MTVWLAMRHDPDEGDDPIGIYEDKDHAQNAAEVNANEHGIWVEEPDVSLGAWFMSTTYGVEYSAIEFEVEGGGPWTPQSSDGMKRT